MEAQQITLAEADGRPLIEVREKEPSFMQLLQFAIENKSAIDVVERLAALQADRVAKRALADFNEALDSCRDEIEEVVPDLKNDTTGKMYASYRALSRALKPIYKKHGLTPTFNTRQSEKPEEIIVLCDLSHTGGHVKQYMIPMPTDGRGPKGGGVMSKPNATVAATSYGRSTLLRLIFDVVIAEEQQGEGVNQDQLKEDLAYFSGLKTYQEVQNHFSRVYGEAVSAGDEKAQLALGDARKKRLKELRLV